MDEDINAIYGGIGTKLGDNMYCRALSTLNLNLEPPPCSIRLDKIQPISALKSILLQNFETYR